MFMSSSKSFFIIFRFILLFNCILFIGVSARGGGGRGGGGGGRGSSAARSSSSSSSSSSHSSYTPSRSSSSYSSSTNTQYNSNFRTNVFHTTTTSTHFVYSPLMHSHVIISPVTPIIYGGHSYYWGGHYVVDHNRPLECEYEINESDEELRNVTFSNGTSPKTISFGCAGSEKCCGMECCSNSSSVWVVVGVIVGLILMCVCCRGCEKRGWCEPQPSVVVGVPVLSTTTTHTTCTSFNAPSPHGPFPGAGNQQFYQPSSGPPPPQPPAFPNAPQYAQYDARPMSSSQVKTNMRY